jgi:hypothetical protein
MKKIRYIEYNESLINDEAAEELNDLVYLMLVKEELSHVE